MSNVEDLTQQLEQLEASLIESNEHYQAILKVNHDSSNKLTELSSLEVDAKSRRNDEQKLQIQIEKEVCNCYTLLC